jgi:hypothetical protein
VHPGALIIKRFLAVTLCVTVVVMGFPPARARDSAARPGADAAPAPDPAPVEVASGSYRLRDAVPAATFLAAQPDTAGDDDFFLPEDTDNKKLIRDIAVFVIIAAFVAFFIVKVFIEKDDNPPPDDGGGKPVPLPQ